MFSKHSQSLNDADSFDDCQPSLSKLGKHQVSEALNRLLKVLIIVINVQSHSVEALAPPWFGGGDHLCPYGRIG